MDGIDLSPLNKDVRLLCRVHQDVANARPVAGTQAVRRTQSQRRWLTAFAAGLATGGMIISAGCAGRRGGMAGMTAATSAASAASHHVDVPPAVDLPPAVAAIDEHPPASMHQLVSDVSDSDPAGRTAETTPASPASFRTAKASMVDFRALMQEDPPVGEIGAAEAELVPPGQADANDSVSSDDPVAEDESDASESSDAETSDTADADESSSLLDGLMLGGASDDDVDLDETLQLPQVVNSVRNFFPVVQSAFLERQRTSGDQLAAWGAFDTKAKAYTENQPLGFYENYQHGAGLVQPRYRGGEVYGGYRIGRGIFEPWYLERETNKGGEFKVGFDLPLARNRDIDKRRADLWRATYDRQLAEPEIRTQIIGAIFEATATYWTWVAAGQQYRIGVAALELAEKRNLQVARRVEEGDLGEPSLADNDRAIALRKAKLLDRRRKLEQSAVKLSLFVRDADTLPLIPPVEVLPPLPEVEFYDIASVEADIQLALSRRPEIEMVEVLYRRTQVDLAEACNDTLPNIDALMNVSQDVGERTSSKGDKSELELEAGFQIDMPLQRRKGLGKARAARAKLRQLQIKRQFAGEKIETEVRAAAAALQAAYGRVAQNEVSVELAERLATVARRQFELGESDLLNVFLREQFAIEAADELVLAKLDYHIARAQYDAAIAAAN